MSHKSFYTILLCSSVYMLIGQSPSLFNYQGIGRMSNGDLLSDKEITIEISLVSGSSTGQIVYSEEHFVTTNDFGLFNLRIGSGNVLLGNMASIDWGSDDHYVRTKMDIQDGNGYVELGTTQLFSVPYALYASNSGSTDQPDSDEQNLSFTDQILSIENGNSIDLSELKDGFEDDDSDPENEIQELIVNGDQLSISNGNTVTLDPGVLPQTLSLDGDDLSISNGNTVSLGLEEFAQTLSLDGEDLSISNGNTISLGLDQLAQTLSLDGDLLTISNGNAITLETPNNFWNAQNGGIGFDGGDVLILNNDQTEALVISRFNQGGGFLNSRGPNGNSNILLTQLADKPDHGFLSIKDPNGTTKAGLFVGDDQTGIGFTDGVNDNRNVSITFLADFPNNGFVSVNDTNGDAQAGLYVDGNGDGRVFADAVDTVIDHPDKSNFQIAYSHIQGPEAAAYLRGTGSLENGSGKVSFPDHFMHVVETGTITVMITPLSADSKGIAVIQKGKGGFQVKELHQGLGNYKFDWEVKGVRKGYGNFKVIKQKKVLEQKSLSGHLGENTIK